MMHLTERFMGVHRQLKEIFLQHQIALLDRRIADARQRLGEFRSAIESHMVDEEQHILPLYQARGGDQTNSPTAQFLTEHRKLRTYIAKLCRLADALTDPPSDAELLELLDAESWFKSLLAHHDQREGKALYPQVEEWSSAAERQAILRLLDEP